MDWKKLFEEIAKYFLGVSVITAGLVYIAKVVLKLLTDRNLEKYKTELSKDVNFQVEKAKKEFERLNKENEIKFSKLHEERANAIKELYKRLVNVEIYLHTFYSQNFKKFNRFYKRNVTVEQLYSKISDFVEFYEINKLLFSKEACDALTILHDSFNLTYISNTEMLEDMKAEENLRKGFESILNNIIPEQKNLLEKEFKENIGINFCD